jgi:hypothetical protein
MSAPQRKAQQRRGSAPVQAELDLDAIEAISQAVESGAGLPEVIRATSRALDASLALIDRSGSVLAIAARGSSDERSLLRGAASVETIELRVGDQDVGQLRLRARSKKPAPALLRLVATLLGSEVERVRGPERASADAVASFLRAVFARELRDRDDLLARSRELGLRIENGGSVIVARAHPRAPVDDDWRSRLLTVVERAARAVAPGSVAAQIERPALHGAEVAALVPDPTPELAVRVGTAILRELETTMGGFTVAVGRSRPVPDPVDLGRAANEALLAANVAEAEGLSEKSFDETGAYRLLLSAMSDDPEELQRFYEETLEPVVAYDEQYETELVHTLSTYLDCDGNVAGTAERLFTHRHTVRYRLERVRELSGHDVGSSDGREKLSLGLKAMRVLGIHAEQGPATEAGAGGGRVPRAAERESQER